MVQLEWSPDLQEMHQASAFLSQLAVLCVCLHVLQVLCKSLQFTVM